MPRIVVQQAFFGPRTLYTPTTQLENTAPAGLEGILITQEIYIHSDLDPVGHQRTPSDLEHGSEDGDDNRDENNDNKLVDPLRGVNAGTTFRQRVTSRWFLFVCVCRSHVPMLNNYVQSSGNLSLH